MEAVDIGILTDTVNIITAQYIWGKGTKASLVSCIKCAGPAVKCIEKRVFERNAVQVYSLKV